MPFVRGSVSRGNAFAVVKREAVAGGVNDSPVDCQSRSVTEPQRDPNPISSSKKGGMPLVGMPPFLLMGFVGAVIDRPFFRSRAYVSDTRDVRATGGRPYKRGTPPKADKRKKRQSA